MLDFKKPMTTRAGSPIRLYHVYKDYIHGAYQSGDDWYVCSWTLPNGFYSREKQMRGSSLDLINNEAYEPELA